MNDEFKPDEFDRWAPEYDRSVSSGTGFPFDGYDRVLQKIVEQSAASSGASVLDLGTGTGNLAVMFAGRGCAMWCLDFSAEMLALAQVKLPGARIAQADIREEWPPAFQRRYDCIVSAYTFHHFLLEEKVSLVQRLLHENLTPDGRLVIGDIAFQNAAAEDAARRSLGEEWDQEYYWLADEALAAFMADGIKASYSQVSSCAGVFKINAGLS